MLRFQPLAKSSSRHRPVRRDRETLVRSPWSWDLGLAPPRWLAAALILIIGSVAYSNSFSGVFVFDDEPAIANNPNLRLWPSIAALAAPADTTLSGRPVASLSFAIDYARASGSLTAYHTTNLVIHLVAALLLFGITRRTLLTEALAERFSRSAATLALIVALVFVVHPIQTGSVTYIVQRVESLMGLFYLATLYCAIRALDAQVGPRTWWTGGAVLSCALGMATKEVMVTAPLMVMLWDRQFAPDRPTPRRKLYASLATTWLILAALMAGGPRTSSAGFGFPEWPWWRYLMTQAEVVTHYLRLAIFPTPLVLDYEWAAAASMAPVIWPAALIVLLLIATVLGLVRRSPAAFAGAWCFLILAPTSSVLPIITEVAAEHRMYLPVAGVIALVVLSLFDLGRRLAGAASSQTQDLLARAGLMAVAVVVILFAGMTYERNADYHDYDRIWSDTIAKRPHNTRARNNYATSLLARGRFAEAEQHLRIALEEKPSFSGAQANLGVALSAQGKLDEGVAHLRRAIELKPDDAEAHRNLGETYALQHRMGDAVAQYAQALEYLPDDVNLLNRAAWILATASEPGARGGARARVFAERAVKLTLRQDAASLDSLGAALAELGDFEAAAAAAGEALELARLKGDRDLSRDLEVRRGLYSRGERFHDQ